MDMWAAIARVLASVTNDLLRDILAVAMTASILVGGYGVNQSRVGREVAQNLSVRTSTT